MDSNTNSDTQTLKPAQLRSLVTEHLKDKRKSTSVLKLLSLPEIEALMERISIIAKDKKDEAEAKAEQERIAREKVESAVSDTMQHLNKQGFKFNRDEVARFLAQQIKPGNDVAIETKQSDANSHVVSTDSSNLTGRGVPDDSAIVQQS